MNTLISWFNLYPKYPFHMAGRKDIIRIHITKTAGTSLTKALNFNLPNKKRGIKKHYFAREIIEIVDTVNWENAFRFSFVRNPWDRLFSMYRYRKRWAKPSKELANVTFDIWLKNEIKNLESHSFRNTRSQVDWLKDNDGYINYDFIGRFENLDQDVAVLGKMINKKINLPHINQSSPMMHYSYAYTDELEELIRINYLEDINTFGYEFERQ